ncbi:MAG TPA: hypothetical protein VK822_34820, partial [Acetobacteraceae bacterium]|nr:hypothetical protein [Acetobacteraceae bacterium]
GIVEEENSCACSVAGDTEVLTVECTSPWVFGGSTAGYVVRVANACFACSDLLALLPVKGCSATQTRTLH